MLEIIFLTYYNILCPVLMLLVWRLVKNDFSQLHHSDSEDTPTNFVIPKDDVPDQVVPIIESVESDGEEVEIATIVELEDQHLALEQERKRKEEDEHEFDEKRYFAHSVQRLRVPLHLQDNGHTPNRTYIDVRNQYPP
jgi:hypothetical protein